jgi:O-acetyl-ADP-ribose deacetylase (regulator of RNase III)
MELVDVVRDDEAEKLLFFFSEELHNEVEKHELEFKIPSNGQQIEILGKETNKNVSVAVVERLRSLVKDKLKQDVIPGNSEDTFDNVKEIIHNCKLKTKVLPLQSTQNRKIVRIFGLKREELDTIKSTYRNPGNPLAEKPSMLSETHVTSQSQGGRTEDRDLGSFTQMDVKYEFDTKEGLHVKLYRKAITKLNVDAIVNAANDKLANIGRVAEVIERAAGSQMKRECEDIIWTHGKVQEGNNVTTLAGNLNYKAVIHAVGPRWYDHQDKSHCLNILRDTIINILKTACRQGYKSVAMPPISSGLYYH